MTEDEKIMLHCLKFIERKIKYIPSGHVNMLTTLWKNWDEYQQNHFRDLLWEKGYVHLDTYPWELQTTTDGKKFIKTKDKELEDAFFLYLSEERNVGEFMAANFIKPNDLSAETINSTDDGVAFLKSLKRRKLVTFDEGALEQVNNWIIPKGKNKHKRWFDNLTGELIVIPTNPFHESGLLEDNNNLKKPDLHSDLRQKQIPVKIQRDRLSFIRNITSGQWQLLIAILMLAIALYWVLRGINSN